MIFDAFAIHQAIAEGYFAAEGLDVSVIVGRGGSDSLQAVLTGSQDLIYGLGPLSVIAAHAKGAPVAIVGNAKRGASEIYWYVPSASPIRSFKDVGTGDLAYSSPGSTTHMIVQTLARELGIAPKLIGVGNMSASRTQVLSGQVQTGYAVFPINLDLVRKGEIRRIGNGDDAVALRHMPNRVIAANTDWLRKNRDVAVRTLRALWRGQEFNFGGGEKALARFAAHWNVDIADVRQVGEYFKLADSTFTPIGDLDGMIRLALDYGFIKEPLTEQQRASLVAIVYQTGRN
jgi:NitT/TauT family transport system substrate-binding protein